VDAGDAARETLARLVDRLRQARADLADVLDEPLMARTEILDQRRARRLQLAVDIGHAARETLADFAGRLVQRVRQARADLANLLDETLVACAEILDQRRTRRLQLAVDVGDAARKTFAHLAGRFIQRVRQARADLANLLDETLVARAEILDQRRTRRLQLAVDVGDAARETFAHLAGRFIQRLRQARADLANLLDETLVARAEILDQRRARRLQSAVGVGHAARKTFACLVYRLRQTGPDVVDLPDHALVMGAELLDERRARRLQPVIDI